MKKGVILIGEPMGLLMAQSEGSLDSVTGYSLAVAGAEFNVAVGLSRLEHPVTYMTKLGPDPFGKLIVNCLTENDIGSDFIQYSQDHTTGFMLKSLVTTGDPEIYYYRKDSAASTLSKEDIDAIDFSACGLLHMTGIFPALSETTREAAFYAMDKAREAGLTITFDPNLRPQLWPSQQVMVDTLNQLAAKADYVFPGEGEGEILCGSRDPKAISAFYLGLGAKAVITKVGSRGAYVATANHQALIPGFTVKKVVDTVGAGDGFAAGTISALLEGYSLDDAARRGNAIGALQVMHRGDNTGLPTRDQLKHFMEENAS